MKVNPEIRSLYIHLLRRDDNMLYRFARGKSENWNGGAAARTYSVVATIRIPHHGRFPIMDELRRSAGVARDSGDFPLPDRGPVLVKMKEIEDRFEPYFEDAHG